MDLTSSNDECEFSSHALGADKRGSGEDIDSGHHLRLQLAKAVLMVTGSNVLSQAMVVSIKLARLLNSRPVLTTIGKISSILLKRTRGGIGQKKRRNANVRGGGPITNFIIGL